MKALLSFLWSGCWHRWALFREDPIHNERGTWFASDFILQCERCGNMKKERL